MARRLTIMLVAVLVVLGAPSAIILMRSSNGIGPSASQPRQLLVGEVSAAPFFGVAPQQAGQSAGITVAGEGVVKAPPDMAYVTTGVQNTAGTAMEAQQENARRMANIVARLEAMGIAKKEMRTVGLSVHPVYEKPGAAPTAYEATNQVVVTIDDIGAAGAVFDSAVEAGANVAGNISFGFKDDVPLRQQALREAVKAARTKADAIAEELGVKITGTEAVVEESASGPPMPVFENVARAMASAPSTPIQPGELTVSSRVRVVFLY